MYAQLGRRTLPASLDIWMYRYFNRSLIKTFTQDKVIDVTTLLKLRRQYDYLSDLVIQMDDIFSPAVFFWYSSFVLSVCIDITFEVTLYHRVDSFALLVSIIKLVVLFVAYAAVGISASLTIEESQKCVPIFYKLTASDRMWSNAYLCHALQMLASHLESSRLALTGWKFFNLNRTYMMTVIGVLMSYIIIVVQLNPRFMTSIITGGFNQ